MKIAAVQFKGVKGDWEASLERLLPLVAHGVRRADLVVLPEMALTGYVFADADAVRAVSEPAEGPTLEALAPLARAGRAWVVAGFPERDGPRLYNSALVIDPTGALAFTYRKTLLFEADLPWATPGDSGYRTFDTGVGRFGVGICMDLNDDRFTAWCREEAPDAVALCANWLDEDLDIWPYWAWRMTGAPGALAVANTWGPEGALRFRGQSAVILGREVLAGAPVEGDGVVAAEVSPGRTQGG
ncbi:MAG: carbon-nitrogen hydrolase family protein [Deltaproteobacteria bacterium]|nr:carbon-nitrogen hydrolase family protein [Deltaproteobacteria bacterium]